MDMQPDVLDYASSRTPRWPRDWLRFANFFAVLCALFAWLRTTAYLDNGQLKEEQATVVVFVVLSIACLGVSLARVRRSRGSWRRKFASVLLCIIVLCCDALAVWNVGQKTMEWNEWLSPVKHVEA